MDLILGIKYAGTEEEWQKCFDYLNSKGTGCLAKTSLFYIEDRNGDIKACAGWNVNFGGAIEPLVSESAIYTRTLGIFMFGYLLGKGFTTISCWTVKEEWQKILEEIGFKVWSGSNEELKLKQYVKEIR